MVRKVEEIKPNLVDRVISWFSPEKAYYRMAYRHAEQEMRNYNAARWDRFGSGWEPVNQKPEETDAAFRDRIKARARDLERNSEIGNSVLLALERNVIGQGIRPQARIKNEDGSDNEDLNQHLEDLWEEWVYACDVTEQSTFYELQNMALRRMIVDGDSLALNVYDTSDFPFKLQMLESDALDTFNSYAKNKRVFSGVEVNDQYKPLAYWIYEDELSLPLKGRNFTSKRISADRILHLFIKKRPQQVRGMSYFAPIMGRVRDMDEYLDAELMASRIAACFAAFIKTKAPGDRIGRQSRTIDGKRRETLEPGIIDYLLPGEDVSFSDPPRPNTKANEFIQMQLRLSGAGVGQSYEMISRDVSQVNYSSARQAHLEDRQGFKVLQQFIKDHFCRPIWPEFVTACVLAGKVRIPDYFSNIKRYTKSVWITPGWQWVDPLKEAAGTQKELDMGITSLSEICAARGKDWQEILDQIRREQEYAEKIGLMKEGGSIAKNSK